MPQHIRPLHAAIAALMITLAPLGAQAGSATVTGEDGSSLRPVSKVECYQDVENCYVDEQGWYLATPEPVEDKPLAAEEQALEAIGKSYVGRMAKAPLIKDGAAVAVGALSNATDTVVSAFERGYRSEDHEIRSISPGDLGSWLNKWQSDGENAVSVGE